ncbi:MAG: acetyl-CoA carboxylase biotin carboxyl carrier protein, partial [Candidatus Competibacteraceae bacterium]
MDIRKIKKLLELLETSGIAEIEIKEGEDSVRISRQQSPGGAPPITLAPSWGGAPAYGPPSAAPGPTPTSQPAAPAVEAIQGHVMRSPMVGTFYRAAAPGSKPLVEVGQRV